LQNESIYTSTDAGESWAADNCGLAGTEVAVQMITNGNNIYCTTATDVWKADGAVSPLA